MSETLDQIYVLNPVTTILDTDLIYLVNSPYTSGDDAAITGASLKALFVLASAIINPAHGGTGLTSLTIHNLLIGNNTANVNLLAPSATSGVPLISQGASSDPAYGTAVVAGGGTGLTSATSYSVICGGVTSTDPFQPLAALGNSGDVLTSNGAGALPSFQPGGGGGGVTSTQVQQSAFNFSTDTGTTNAYVGIYNPVIGSLTDGLTLLFLPASANTIGTPSIDVGTGAVTISTTSSAPIAVGDMQTNEVSILTYNTAANAFFLQNPASSVNVANNSMAGKFNSVSDTGSPDTYIAANPYFPTASLVDGMYVFLKVSNDNTGGAATFAYNGAGAFPIQLIDGTNPPASAMKSGGISILYLTVGASIFQLLNPLIAGGGGVTSTQVQQNTFNFAVDSGAVNAYVGVYSPAITVPTDGLTVYLNVGVTNTSNTVTFDAGFGASSVVTQDNADIAIFDMRANQTSFLTWNNSINKWVLQNPATSVTFETFYNSVNTVTDTGAADAYIGTNAYYPSEAPLSSSSIVYLALITASNSGACTFNYNGIGALSIVMPDLSTPPANALIATSTAILFFTGTSWILLNPATFGAGGSSPWSSGAGTGSAKGGDGTEIASGNYSLSYGTTNTGSPNTALGLNSLAIGSGNIAAGDYDVMFGDLNQTTGGTHNYFFGSGISSAVPTTSFTYFFGDNSFINGITASSYIYSFGSSNNTSTDVTDCYMFGRGNQVNADKQFALGFGSSPINIGSAVWNDNSGSSTTDTGANQFVLSFAGGFYQYTGDVSVATAGKGLRVAEGSDAKQGIATLTTGSVTVTNASVTLNSRIFLTAQDNNSTGALRISARNDATDFTITSSNPTDSGDVAYQIFEPA